ncbi:MAG: sigma-70 family RNA polymerase sigma factor [Bacteroidaceae bacterium]|nr:sigma-70 family RNA polymerase sigma factor [Bacteroidaceae bacterium]
MNEAEIIDAVQRGRAGSHEAVVRMYVQEVARLVARLVPNALDAEEVVQDVFLKAFRSMEQFDARRATLGTWLCRIAYSTAIDWLRRRSPQWLSLDDIRLQEYEETDEAEALLLEETADKDLLLDQLFIAIDALPPPDQALITMFYFEGRSLSDIAFITQQRAGTVATRLHRIRKRLYEKLKVKN